MIAFILEPWPCARCRSRELGDDLRDPLSGNAVLGGVSIEMHPIE